jgi:hypothetical protein
MLQEEYKQLLFKRQRGHHPPLVKTSWIPTTVISVSKAHLGLGSN